MLVWRDLSCNRYGTPWSTNWEQNIKGITVEIFRSQITSIQKHY
jgi:hypothetical protein